MIVLSKYSQGFITSSLLSAKKHWMLDVAAAFFGRTAMNKYITKMDDLAIMNSISINDGFIDISVAFQRLLCSVTHGLR